MQKRDFYTKRNSNLHLLFYVRPFKELCWWIIYYCKYLLFFFSTKTFLRIRHNFLQKTRSYARRSPFGEKYYANSTNKYYELQIKNNTRVCNVFKEGENLSFKSTGNKNTFIFGIASLIEPYNHKNIKKWTLEITLTNERKILDNFSIEFPFNEGNRSHQSIYTPHDGWVDLSLDLSKYNNKKVEINFRIFLEKKEPSTYKEEFSLACPQFVNKKNNAKNIILLSLESLSDLNYLKETYGLEGYKNLNKLIDESELYEEVFSPIDATLTYAASMISGLLPSQHCIGDYSVGSDSFDNKVLNNSLKTLPEILKEEGFLNFFGGTAGRFSSKLGFAHGFDDHYQVNTNFDINRPTINSLINGLEAYKNLDKFFFFHLDHLHEPYLSFGNETKPSLYDPRHLDKKNKNLNSDLYSFGLKKLDRDIGMLIKYLQDENEFDNSLILLTGDHGNGINWEKGDDYSLYEERLRVPLVVKHPVWSEINEIKKDNSVNSVFKIHEIINDSLDLEFPKELKVLPQYSALFEEFTFAETIMMPAKQRNRHSLTVMSEKYKYVCWNLIDWDSFKLLEILKEKVFLREEGSSLYDETKNVLEDIDELELSLIRKVAYNVINQNLEFLKKHPPQAF